MNGHRTKYALAIAIALLTCLAAFAVIAALGGFARSASEYWLVLTALLLVAAAALVLLQRSGRGATRELSEIASALDRVAEGDFDISLDAEPKGAFIETHRAFDRMRRRLRATTISKDYFDRLLSSISEVLLITDSAGRILRANDSAAQALGYKPAELTKLSMTDIFAAQDVGRSDVSPTGASPREGSFVRSNGSQIPVSYTVSEIRDDAGQMEGRVYTAQDIGERKRAEQRIRYLARTDTMTKMANRMQFQHLLQQGIARTRRLRQHLALLYIDIDRFKDINDTFGHTAGDTSLEIFARRMAGELGENATAGRLAGDEFAVLFSGFDDVVRLTGEVSMRARRLLRAIGRPFQIQGEEIFITASMGIAVCPRDGEDVAELLRNADAALYRAKKAGGNCFEFYTADMNTAAVERLMLKSKLRRALERDELALHYQPKYSVKTGRVEGVEALLRWDLPDRGSIPPSDFIPLAEETNLILQLGEWVLSKVCGDYRQWQQELAVPVRVSVNLSLRQLQQQRFLERVQAIFRSHGVSPTSLELEITETTLMEDINRTVRILDSLYAMGLHLAIDDFGTGYSSLGALQQFPIGTLKIDQSFVRDLATNRDDAAIVETIIKMARSLKMEVVAEGVESQAQLEFLRRLGCDYVQGRLFGHPMTGAEFLALLHAQAEGTDKHRTLFA
jgi:diguanylate cyclase (GGDEF)-like protein/PAS domain S-box-containing protein